MVSRRLVAAALIEGIAGGGFVLVAVAVGHWLAENSQCSAPGPNEQVPASAIDANARRVILNPLLVT
jgi:hypothetical protein